jgi:RNA polymerase sigma-70 factor, ECF subfamily
MGSDEYDAERKLHKRLLNGDVTASAEIAERLLFSVIRLLRYRYQDLDDPHLVDMAVHQAFISYFYHPQRYNPAKSSLTTYLLMSADGDLRNFIHNHKFLFQLSMDTSNGDDEEQAIVVADDFDLETEVLNRLSTVWPRLRDYLPDPVEREVVWLMLDNIRETAIYADVLGLQDVPATEQQAIVKRHKDRLRKKLRRLMNQAEFRNNG